MRTKTKYLSLTKIFGVFVLAIVPLFVSALVPLSQSGAPWSALADKFRQCGVTCNVFTSLFNANCNQGCLCPFNFAPGNGDNGKFNCKNGGLASQYTIGFEGGSLAVSIKSGTGWKDMPLTFKLQGDPYQLLINFNQTIYRSTWVAYDEHNQAYFMTMEPFPR